MEIITAHLIYKDENKQLTVLYDRGDVVTLYKDRVNHFNAGILDDLTKLGLYIDDIVGRRARQAIIYDVLELQFKYELENFNNKNIGK